VPHKYKYHVHSLLTLIIVFSTILNATPPKQCDITIWSLITFYGSTTQLVPAPPPPTIIEPYSEYNISNYNPIIRGTSIPNARITLFVDDTTSGKTIADAQGIWLFNHPTILKTGPHTISATATTQNETSKACTPIACTIIDPLKIIFLDTIHEPYDIYSLLFLGALKSDFLFDSYLTFSPIGAELIKTNGIAAHGSELRELVPHLGPTHLGFTLGGPTDFANKKILSLSREQRAILSKNLVNFITNNPEYSCLCIDFEDTPPGKNLAAAATVATYIHDLAIALKKTHPNFMIALTAGRPIENMRIFSTPAYQDLFNATCVLDGKTRPIIDYIIVNAIDFDTTDRTQNPFNGNVTSASAQQTIKTRALWPDYIETIDWSATGIINYLIAQARVPQSKLIIQLPAYVNTPTLTHQPWFQLSNSTKALLEDPEILDADSLEVILGNPPLCAAYNPPQAIQAKTKYYIKKLNFNKNRLAGTAIAFAGDDPNKEIIL
jgi:hypothetical protein